MFAPRAVASLGLMLFLALSASGCDCGGGADDDDDSSCRDRCSEPACARDPACVGGDEDCGNRSDDDGDGAVDCDDPDCANDPDCAAPSEDCENETDDDGDGAVDCDDTDCAGDGNCVPTEERDCDDGTDDDLDGEADCLDEDCDLEGSCEFGEEVTCGDGVDNDGDGDTDCDDADCPADECASREEDCGTVGDEDDDGLPDCLDPDCDLIGICEHGSEATCTGGDDNDGDGLPDCLDPDCDGRGGCELGTEESCADGDDNDGDGSSDCDDADCAGATECVPDCAVEGCPGGLRCAYGVCIPELPCGTNDDCLGDTRCDAGFCVPWELPDGIVANAECRRDAVVGDASAALQCSFRDVPGDELPEFNEIVSSPMVADLDLDDDPTTVAPSIVLSAWSPSGLGPPQGVIRILDGRTCTLLQSFTDPADRVTPTSPAIGDLDADGHPEIVINRPTGGLIAFGWDGVGAYARVWTSAVCDDAGNRVDDTFPEGGCGLLPCASNDGGVSLHDLDDDGSPEIVYGAAVYDAQGCRLDDAQGLHIYYGGHAPVLADVDLDGIVEWVSGDAMFEWLGDHMEPDPDFVAPGLDGYAAVAEVGDFPGAAGDAPGVAEIVVAGHDELRLQSVGGDILFGPFSPAGLQSNFGDGRYGGGPPTIADFDGDGRLEMATAGTTAYYVFDLDCDFDPVPAGCEARGILWSIATQDGSSGDTGSTVFDFDGDGAAEVIYADECYLRIYDGPTGAVEWSVSRSSVTGTELPIVADVDGDFRAEIVVGLNSPADFLPCPVTDPHDASVSFAYDEGIRVFGDVGDTWVPARPIWNQHAYSVTNVRDDGSIPRTSEWIPNWTVPGLNDFRKNIESHYEPLAALDLTVSCTVTPACGGDDPSVAFDCDVCNRGLGGIDAGVLLRLYEVDPAQPFCDLPVDQALASGACAPVACTWHIPGGTFDVTAAVDYANDLLECYDGNNSVLLEDVGCP